MSRDTGYLHYILDEVLTDIPGITFRGMFSGFGLYKNGVIFGMILGTQLYFKTDEETRKDYEARGSTQFSFEKKNKKIMLTAYYEVPSEIMEDREEIAEWVEKAVAIRKIAKE